MTSKGRLERIHIGVWDSDRSFFGVFFIYFYFLTFCFVMSQFNLFLDKTGEEDDVFIGGISLTPPQSDSDDHCSTWFPIKRYAGFFLSLSFFFSPL